MTVCSVTAFQSVHHQKLSGVVSHHLKLLGVVSQSFRLLFAIFLIALISYLKRLGAVSQRFRLLLLFVSTLNYSQQIPAQEHCRDDNGCVSITGMTMDVCTSL